MSANVSLSKLRCGLGETSLRLCRFYAPRNYHPITPNARQAAKWSCTCLLVSHELNSFQEFHCTREAKRRFLGAYSLMLDFYGIKLLDKSGNVARASNWQERFQHLNE